MPTYTIELAWEFGLEVPVAYLCENGVFIAQLYDDPVLKDDASWTDDLAAWEPGPASQEILTNLRLGVEYSRGVHAILAQYGRSAHNMADPVNPRGEDTERPLPFYTVRENQNTVVIHLPFRRPMPYTRDSLVTTIENITRERNAYETEEDFQYQLSIYSKALEFGDSTIWKVSRETSEE